MSHVQPGPCRLEVFRSLQRQGMPHRRAVVSHCFKGRRIWRIAGYRRALLHEMRERASRPVSCAAVASELGQRQQQGQGAQRLVRWIVAAPSCMGAIALGQSGGEEAEIDPMRPWAFRFDSTRAGGEVFRGLLCLNQGQTALLHCSTYARR